MTKMIRYKEKAERFTKRKKRLTEKKHEKEKQ